MPRVFLSESRPRVQKFDRRSLKVPHVAGRQYEIVLHRNRTNCRVREIDGITRPIGGGNDLCVSLGRALAKRENSICEQRCQFRFDYLPKLRASLSRGQGRHSGQ